VNELAARNELLEREVRLRREAEGRIRAMAYQNPLTRLPNRGLLGDRFAVATAQARRHGQKRCADQALYAAKADGRGTYRYFSEIRVA
jgi:GGDEF domain-containing protein